MSPLFDFCSAVSNTDLLDSSCDGLTVPLAVDEELESSSAGIGRAVMTWVTSREKNLASRYDIVSGVLSSTGVMHLQNRGYELA